jgi:hypothetical protein
MFHQNVLLRPHVPSRCSVEPYVPPQLKGGKSESWYLQQSEFVIPFGPFECIMEQHFQIRLKIRILSIFGAQ